MKRLKKQYEKIELQILFYSTDVITASGDGWVEDPFIQE